MARILFALAIMLAVPRAILPENLPADTGAYTNDDWDAPAGTAADSAPAKAKSGMLFELEKYVRDYNKTYFIYVDKKINRMYLMDRTLKIWRKYPVATGMMPGDKLYEKDLKTPAGVYYMQAICQYHEPWYLPRFRAKIKKLAEGSPEQELYKKYYEKLKKRYLVNKKRVTDLNNAYLSAEQGHVKFGTGVSLGYNAYGPVFIRLNYPNESDWQRYEDAKDEGLIPRRNDLYYKSPGGGIAIHASAGCIRMRNDHIVELSDYIMEGTMVIID
jgi:murein L,D-transpeptidase YafK